MRKRLWLVAPLALGLAACGGSKSALDSKDLLGSAAANTEAAGSYKIATTGRATFGSQTISLRGQGAFDNEAKRGRLNLTLTIPGAGTATLDEIFNKGIILVKSPLFAQALPMDKQWIRINAARAGEQVGFNLKAVMGQTPDEVLAHLRRASATTVTEVGDEDLNNVPTTHYRADIDLDKLASDRAQRLSDASYKPIDVWVDEEGRVRRLKLDFTAKVAATETARSHSILTIDLSDFGTPVEVDIPPPGQIVNATDAVAGG
jgi:hypothetical protein